MKIKAENVNDDVSVITLINLKANAGIAKWDYCVNSKCPHYWKDDRFGCHKGHPINCDTSMTIDREYFNQETLKQERIDYYKRNSFKNGVIPVRFMEYVHGVDRIVEEYDTRYNIKLVAKYNADNYRYEILYDGVTISYYGFGYDDHTQLISERYECGIRGPIHPYGDIDADEYRYCLIREDLDEAFGVRCGSQVLKDNLCKMVFLCIDRRNSDCVYYNGVDGVCKYAQFTELSDFSYCGSSVARVNKMALEMKRLGISDEQ